MKPVVKKAKPPEIPVREYIAEYVQLREEKKRIENRLKVISDALKDVAERKGQKDDKGSYYFERDNYIVGKQARKSVSFDIEKATKFFRRKGFPECIATVEQIDMEAVEELLDSGEITVEDLEAITTTNVTYSIDVKPVEQVTDEVVEITANKSRPRLIRR